jgi:hypothetical protein
MAPWFLIFKGSIISVTFWNNPFYYKEIKTSIGGEFHLFHGT